MLTGCNPVKTISSVVPSEDVAQTPADYQLLKLDLDPSKDIPEYKRSLMPFADLPKTETYLNGLLDQIIVSNKLEDVFVNKKPQIKVSVDSSFNAITLKHGLIVVATGMLLQLETEAELQAVFAHELIHLLNEDHQKDEMQKNSKKGFEFGKNRLMAKYLGAASQGDLINKALPDLLGQQILDDLMNSVVFTKWNREQELRSDLSGVHLLHGAGINEKYMLKFLNKRKVFETKNSDLFESQNNEESEIAKAVTSLFSSSDSQKNNVEIEEVETSDSKQNDDSITAKYYSAHTRHAAVKKVLLNDIGKDNLNKRSVKGVVKLKKSLPNYRALINVYEVRHINNILEDKELTAKKRSSKALDIIKKAQKEGLKNNSYLNLIRASVYESGKKNSRYALKYRNLALKDPNATLIIYSSIISYFDSQKNKEMVLSLIDKVNLEMDYPNSYLPNTIKFKKKYGESTDEAEAQCIRTFDMKVARACQLALGRQLNFKLTSLANALNTNDSVIDEEEKNTDNTATEKESSNPLQSLGNLLPF